MIAFNNVHSKYANWFKLLFATAIELWAVNLWKSDVNISQLVVIETWKKKQNKTFKIRFFKKADDKTE